MELRHLRYFVAVAEEGSLTNAAERRLHTAQPSLSRQIRDLEIEVGVPLLERGARGISLTAAGRIFLDHARLALLQVEAAGEAARRAARPEKRGFNIGFLAGQELVWLPEALRILRAEQPDIEIALASQSSPELAGALMRGTVDVAFLRREKEAPGIAFKHLMREPLVAVLSADHPLAAQKTVRIQDLAKETYISPTRVAPALKKVIENYAAASGVALKADYDAENLSSAVSLVTSTGGVTLLPLYVKLMLPPSVVIRPLRGDAPAIELVLGYSRSNMSALLKRFLASTDQLVARVSKTWAEFPSMT
ncbi:MAG: LysR family transcriptional regulator [Hyphomicrobiales bacterium]|nr:MAG: LysR family transcriptional regulator [Hyphomicrobiales bacterium]